MKPMPTWTTSDTIMLSVGVGFGLMMVMGGISTTEPGEDIFDSNILLGSGVGLIMASFLVAFMYNRNMKNLNKLIYDGRIRGPEER